MATNKRPGERNGTSDRRRRRVGEGSQELSRPSERELSLNGEGERNDRPFSEIGARPRDPVIQVVASQVDPSSLPAGTDSSLSSSILSAVQRSTTTPTERIRTLSERVSHIPRPRFPRIQIQSERTLFELRRKYQGIQRINREVLAIYNDFLQDKLEELVAADNFCTRVSNLNLEEARFDLAENMTQIRQERDALLVQHEDYLEVKRELAEMRDHVDASISTEDRRKLKRISRQVCDYDQATKAYEALISYHQERVARAQAVALGTQPAQVEHETAQLLDLRGQDEYQHETDPVRRHPLNDKSPFNSEIKTFLDIDIRLDRGYLFEVKSLLGNLAAQQTSYRSDSAPWRVLPLSLSLPLYLGHFFSGFSKNSALSRLKDLRKSYHSALVEVQYKVTRRQQAIYQAAAEKFLCEPVSDNSIVQSAYEDVAALSRTSKNNPGNFLIRSVSQLHRSDLISHLDAEVQATTNAIRVSKSKKPGWFLQLLFGSESATSKQIRKDDKGYLTYLGYVRREIGDTLPNLLLEVAEGTAFANVRTRLAAELQRTRNDIETQQSFVFLNRLSDSVRAYEYLTDPQSVERIVAVLRVLKQRAQDDLPGKYNLLPGRQQARKDGKHYIAQLDAILAVYDANQDSLDALAKLPKEIKITESKSQTVGGITDSQRFIRSYNEKQAQVEAHLTIPASFIQRSPYAFEILCNSQIGRGVLMHFQRYYASLTPNAQDYWDGVLGIIDPATQKEPLVGPGAQPRAPRFVGTGEAGQSLNELTEIAQNFIKAFMLPVVDAEFTRTEWVQRQQAYKGFLDYLDRNLSEDFKHSSSYDMVKACHYSIDNNSFTVSEQVAARGAFLIGPYGEAANALFGKGRGDHSIEYTKQILKKAIAHVDASIREIVDPLNLKPYAKLKYGLELALAIVKGDVVEGQMLFYKFGEPETLINLADVLGDPDSVACLNEVMVPERMEHETDQNTPVQYLVASYIQTQARKLRSALAQESTLEQRIAEYSALVEQQKVFNQYVALIGRFAPEEIVGNFSELLSIEAKSPLEKLSEAVDCRNGDELDLTRPAWETTVSAITKLALLSGVSLYQPVLAKPISDYLYGSLRLRDFSMPGLSRAQQALIQKEAGIIGRLIYAEQVDSDTYAAFVATKLAKHSIALEPEIVAQIVTVGTRAAQLLDTANRAACRTDCKRLLLDILRARHPVINEEHDSSLSTTLSDSIRPFAAYTGQSDAYAKFILLLGTPKQRASWAKRRFKYLLEHNLAMTANDSAFFDFFLKTMSENPNILESKALIQTQIDKVAETFAKAEGERFRWTRRAHVQVEHYCGDASRQYLRIKRLVELAARHYSEEHLNLAKEFINEIRQLSLGNVSGDETRPLFSATGPVAEYRHEQFSEVLTQLETANPGDGQRWAEVVEICFSAAAPNDLVERLRLNNFEYLLIIQNQDADAVGGRLLAYVNTIKALDKDNHALLPGGHPRLCSASEVLKQRALVIAETYLVSYLGQKPEAVPYLVLLSNADLGAVTTGLAQSAVAHLRNWLDLRLGVLLTEDEGSLKGFEYLDAYFLDNFFKVQDEQPTHKYRERLQSELDKHVSTYIARDIQWNVNAHEFIEAYASPALKQLYRLKAIEHLLTTHFTVGYESETLPRTLDVHNDVIAYLRAIKARPLGSNGSIFDMDNPEVAERVISTLTRHLNELDTTEAYHQYREKWSPVADAIFTAIAPDYLLARLRLNKVAALLSATNPCAIAGRESDATLFKAWVDLESTHAPDRALRGMQAAEGAGNAHAEEYQRNAQRREVTFATYLTANLEDASARQAHLNTQVQTGLFIPVAILYASSEEKQAWLVARFALLFAQKDVYPSNLDRVFFEHIRASSDVALRNRFNALIRDYIYHSTAQEPFTGWTEHRWSSVTQKVITQYASKENSDAYLSKAICEKLDSSRASLNTMEPLPQEVLTFIRTYLLREQNRRGFSEAGKVFLSARVDSYLRPLADNAQATVPWHLATQLLLAQLTMTTGVRELSLDDEISLANAQELSPSEGESSLASAQTPSLDEDESLLVEVQGLSLGGEPLLERDFLERYQAERIAELLGAQDAKSTRLEQARNYVTRYVSPGFSTTQACFASINGRSALSITFSNYLSQQKETQAHISSDVPFDVTAHAEYLFSCFATDAQLLDLRCQKLSELIDYNSRSTNESYAMFLRNVSTRSCHYDEATKRFTIATTASEIARLDTVFASEQVTHRPWSVHVEALITTYGKLERLDFYCIQRLEELIREGDTVKAKAFIDYLQKKSVRNLVVTPAGQTELLAMLKRHAESKQPWSPVVMIFLQQVVRHDGLGLTQEYTLKRAKEILQGESYFVLPAISENPQSTVSSDEEIEGNENLQNIGFFDEGRDLWQHSGHPDHKTKVDNLSAKFGENNFQALALALHDFFVKLNNNPSAYTEDAVAFAEYYLSKTLYLAAGLPKENHSFAVEAIRKFGKICGNRSTHKAFEVALAADKYGAAAIQYRDIAYVKTSLPSIAPSSSSSDTEASTQSIRVNNGAVTISKARKKYEQTTHQRLQENTELLSQEGVVADIKVLATAIVDTHAKPTDMSAMKGYVEKSKKLMTHATSQLALSSTLTQPVSYLATRDEDRQAFCDTPPLSGNILGKSAVDAMPELAFYIDMLKDGLVNSVSSSSSSRQEVTYDDVAKAAINYINIVNKLNTLAKRGQKLSSEDLTCFRDCANSYMLNAYTLQSEWLKRELRNKVALPDTEGLNFYREVFANSTRDKAQDFIYIEDFFNELLAQLPRTLTEVLVAKLVARYEDDKSSFNSRVQAALKTLEEGTIVPLLTLLNELVDHTCVTKINETSQQIANIRTKKEIEAFRADQWEKQKSYEYWHVQSLFQPILTHSEHLRLAQAFVDAGESLLPNFSDVMILAADSSSWLNAWHYNSSQTLSSHEAAIKRLLDKYPRVREQDSKATFTQAEIVPTISDIAPVKATASLVDKQRILAFVKENIDTLETIYGYPFTAAYIMVNYEKVQGAYERVMANLSAFNASISRTSGFNMSTDDCIVLIRCLDQKRRQQLIGHLGRVKIGLTGAIAELFAKALAAKNPLGPELALFRFYFELGKVARTGTPALEASFFDAIARFDAAGIELRQREALRQDLDRVVLEYPLLTEVVLCAKQKLGGGSSSSEASFDEASVIVHYSQYKACIDRLREYEVSRQDSSDERKVDITSDLVLPAVQNIPATILQLLQSDIDRALKVDKFGTDRHRVKFLSGIVTQIGSEEQKRFVQEQQAKFEREESLSVLTEASKSDVYTGISEATKTVDRLVDQALILDDGSFKHTLAQLRGKNNGVLSVNASACMEVLLPRLQTDRITFASLKRCVLYFEALLDLDSLGRGDSVHDPLLMFIYKVLRHPELREPLSRQAFINKVIPILVKRWINEPGLLDSDLGKGLAREIGINVSRFTPYAEINVIYSLQQLSSLCKGDIKHDVDQAIQHELELARSSVSTSFDPDRQLFQALFILKFGGVNSSTRTDEREGVARLLSRDIPENLMTKPQDLRYSPLGTTGYHLQSRMSKVGNPSDGRTDVARYRMAYFLLDSSNAGHLELIFPGKPLTAIMPINGVERMSQVVLDISRQLETLLTCVRSSVGAGAAMGSVERFLTLRGCSAVADGDNINAKLDLARNLLILYRPMLLGMMPMTVNNYDERLQLLSCLDQNIEVLSQALASAMSVDDICTIPSAKAVKTFLSIDAAEMGRQNNLLQQERLRSSSQSNVAAPSTSSSGLFRSTSSSSLPTNSVSAGHASQSSPSVALGGGQPQSSVTKGNTKKPGLFERFFLTPAAAAVRPESAVRPEGSDTLNTTSTQTPKIERKNR